MLAATHLLRWRSGRWASRGVLILGLALIAIPSSSATAPTLRSAAPSSTTS